MQVFVDVTGDFTVKRVHDFRIFLKPARRDGALATSGEYSLRETARAKSRSSQQKQTNVNNRPFNFIY